MGQHCGCQEKLHFQRNLFPSNPARWWCQEGRVEAVTFCSSPGLPCTLDLLCQSSGFTLTLCILKSAKLNPGSSVVIYPVTDSNRHWSNFSNTPRGVLSLTASDSFQKKSSSSYRRDCCSSISSGITNRLLQ